MMCSNKYKRGFCLVLFFVLSLAVSSFGQLRSDSVFSTEKDVEASLKKVPCDNKDRLEGVRKLFIEMGAKENEIAVETFNKGKISNLIVKKKGKSDQMIVIGAHYDELGAGCGVIDNWTGISIIAHIYKTFRRVETEKTLVFVAFGEEEKGLLGSEKMADAIPKTERARYCAMINFDSFGFALPSSLQKASSSKMVSIAQNLAKEGKFNFVDVDLVGANSDSYSFKDRDIPSISLMGLDNRWKEYLHTKEDQLENIKMWSVYYGYRFGLVYTSKIDKTVCAELRGK